MITRGPLDRLLRIALATAALFGGSLPGAWAAPAKPRRPRVTISIKLTQEPALYVRARAWAHDPAHLLHCPALTWEWGDGTESKQSCDCDPYAFPERDPELYAPDPAPLHPYPAPGVYTVRVTFYTATARFSESAFFVARR